MPRSDQFTTVDDFELHYSAWGDPANPPVLCVHGLSRVGRDFDPLAAALEDEYHVICPDMPGRGLSQWAADPAERYADAAMVDALVGLCDRLELDSLRYVGTSMGAGLGMAVAAGPLSDRISHLVVNDMPPNPETDAAPEALGRIMEYVPDPPTFERITELEAYYKDLYQGRFSPMSDEEWRRFTVTSARRTGNGGIAPAYDPAILVESESDDDAPAPWDVWESLDQHLCILRGKESEILPQDPFERMQETQPDAQTVEVDCGHAPSLNTDAQIEPIREFLAE
ncbi:alpha/beta fold hydrolase [Halorientalis brevis]|uniref:Alpha/beta fold hydrolase n=1 Tax=Halorientalis brevis TaxID=1126241 RepID=A0ABD6C8A0_9EURY|nr:alpha/beta hydrolase [Halorientalis brevis]